MSKSKPLSRNKMIKILHKLTGKTYKECREALKEMEATRAAYITFYEL